MKPARDKIIAELAQTNLIQDYYNFSRLASALERGDSKDDIMLMSEVEKWPGLFRWLQERL